MRRLNTNPLQNFFAAIRQQGGNSELTRGFQKLFFKQSSTGNCADDFDTLLAQFSNKKSDVPALVPAQTTCESLDIDATEYRSKDFGDNLVKKNPIAYVAVYLLNRCFKKHTCSNCKDALITDNLDDNSNLLNFFKAYESAKNFGGLLIPSSLFLQYVEQLEDISHQLFNIN